MLFQNLHDLSVKAAIIAFGIFANSVMNWCWKPDAHHSGLHSNLRFASPLPHGVADGYASEVLAVNPTVSHMCGMTREDPLVRVRLPEPLKTQIQAAAADARRSMNAEIVSRLEASFGTEKGEINPVATTDLAQRVAQLESAFMVMFGNVGEAIDRLDKAGL